MATLTIRDVSAQTLDTLKERARRNGRSMQQEILAILDAEAEDRRSVLAQIDALTEGQSRRTQADEV
ncbi:MAG: hypothetical protein CVU56_29735 [Deltaproteobacteria bacterium HGW-Deltaproteobacteria-14]|jgi:plasmid stability protein|nr:MAG: hypothetical protein CVU56_29735 [Deltaproteobacteria bacterium HGW-Deltaproteobacteria-14]